MGYLIPSDYNRVIQDVSLQQVISGNAALLTSMELTARAEVISYLRQKYDTDKEFTETQLYNALATYRAADRVYLDATAYSSAATYAVGQLVLQGGKVYKCTTAIEEPELFNEGHWTLLGSQYDIFYAKYPHPVFDIQSTYRKGDQVFYKDHIYTALADSMSYTHYSLIQYNNIDDIPYRNSFPDDPDYGAKRWRDDGLYEVPAGALNDTSYFTFGDNRNQQMVQYLLDIIIYRLYCRISPKDVPQQRENNYHAVILWLKNAAKGNDITVELTKLQPPTGGRIRYGGNVKQQNTY